jgi:membrane protein DedA with SNARE-associated domain
MMMLNGQEWIERLSSLSLETLYLVCGGMAAFENVFPPFPSDIVVALAVFLSARAGGPFWAAALATCIGSVTGAMLMYYVGRRYGSLILLEKLERFAGKSAAERLKAMHAKYGVLALFVSRFIPGVRAVVPPFAGAMRLPAWQVFVSMTVAGALWYGFVAYLAYKAGERWDLLVKTLAGSTQIIALIAVAVVLGWVAVWYIAKKRRGGAPDDAV